MGPDPRIDIAKSNEFSDEVGKEIGQNVFNQVFNAPVTVASGTDISIQQLLLPGDKTSLEGYLISNGLTRDGARLATELISESEISDKKDANSHAVTWLEKIGDAGISVASTAAKDVLIEAALRFFGLK